jgi:hypothetical protein
VSVAGAGAGAAGLASSFAGGGVCSEGPQATRAKLAKSEMAMHNTKSFFIDLHLLSIGILYSEWLIRSSNMHIL